jgi:hypothetical protein
MSALYTLLFKTRCRSNHHRLALDALRHLKGPDAEAWRTMFMVKHEDYLTGAKAPDEEFKDFKNHVLHVREGEWGGAIEAAEEWYRRTLRALQQKDWSQAAWSAGVMSHYFLDPFQPFHTHQTEEENVIHRAVEWSFSKSYETFQALIETKFGGYPNVDVPAGDDWLAQMLRAGAHESNKHYETVIDHYNFDVGVKDPPAGLDDVLRETIAPLIGFGAVSFARVLDKACEEAGVAAPNMSGAVQVAMAALDAPRQAVKTMVANQAAKKEVAAQHAEYNRTGKVRATLGADDKDVRALHAAEVLKTPLSSLNSKWPREIGAKAGAPLVEAKPEAEKKKPEPIAAAPAPVVVTQADVEASLMAPQEPRGSGLRGASPIVDAPAIGPKTAKRLEAVGLKTISDLLAAAPEDASQKIGAKHISAQLIRDWQAQAQLACAIPGLRSREAQALVACNVRDVQTLAGYDAHALAEAIGHWGISDDAARVWGNAPAPSEHDVAAWIDAAHRAQTSEAA